MLPEHLLKSMSVSSIIFALSKHACYPSDSSGFQQDLSSAESKSNRDRYFYRNSSVFRTGTLLRKIFATC